MAIAKSQSTKLTPRQKAVVEKMKANPDWRIRYAVTYGKLVAYFWGAPLPMAIDLRVFDSLRTKSLIEEDGSIEYWRLREVNS